MHDLHHSLTHTSPSSTQHNTQTSRSFDGLFKMSSFWSGSPQSPAASSPAAGSQAGSPFGSQGSAGAASPFASPAAPGHHGPNATARSPAAASPAARYVADSPDAQNVTTRGGRGKQREDRVAALEAENAALRREVEE